jgi:manganese/zinc/iron transport system permease protein
MSNPYWDQTFFGFLVTLLKRMGELCSGGVLAADEIQMGTLSFIAICCGVIGPLLVLKKETMLANSLSHTILLGLVVTTLLATGSIPPLMHLLIGALLSALLTATVTHLLIRFCRLQEDASIGLTFTVLFALGIIFVSLFTRDVHLGVEAVLGNVDLLRIEDLQLSGWLAGINVLIIVFCFWPLQTDLFDRLFARTVGIRGNLLQGMMLLMTAATCIGAFRAVGVLLVLSFLVLPYLIARLFSHRCSLLMVTTPLIGIAVSLVGVALSRHCLTAFGIPLSTGGIIATLLALLYPLARLLSGPLQSIRHAHDRSIR